MAALLVFLFPPGVMVFMLIMDRVELPLRRVAVETQVEEFLDTARPEEVDTLVLEGLATALRTWEDRRRRRGISRLLPSKRSTSRAGVPAARHRA